jgi:hypothetical protein
VQVLYHSSLKPPQAAVRAIDFSANPSFAKDGEMFYSEIPLKDVAAGNYQYLRVSLAYQNYDVMLHGRYFSKCSRELITLLYNDTALHGGQFYWLQYLRCRQL